MGLDRFDTDKPDTDDYPGSDAQEEGIVDAITIVDVRVTDSERIECTPEDFDEVLEYVMEMAEVLEQEANEVFAGSPVEAEVSVPKDSIEDTLSDEFARTFEHYP